MNVLGLILLVIIQVRSEQALNGDPDSNYFYKKIVSTTKTVTIPLVEIVRDLYLYSEMIQIKCRKNIQHLHIIPQKKWSHVDLMWY